MSYTSFIENLHKLICNDVGISLKGAALQYYQRNVDSYLTTVYSTKLENNVTIIDGSALVKCRTELWKKFVEEQQEKNLHLWNSLKQKNQSIDEFGTTVASLGTLLKLADPLIILTFKEGISDEMVRIKILPCKCDTLEKAIEKAKQFEFAEKLGRKHTPQVNSVECKQKKQFSDNIKTYHRSSDRGKTDKKKESNGPAPKKFCWIC